MPEANRIVMKCYYKSKPKVNGYRQRMHVIWRDMGMINKTELRLINQQSQVKKKL